jgi:hypothetical protein
MIIFPEVHLPDYFTQLLKMNVQTLNYSWHQVAVHIYQNKSFHALLEHYFREFDPKARIEVIVQTISWPGFRSRMAAIFLYYAIHGHYPENIPLDLSRDLDSFEEKLFPYTLGGHSRGYLLGFYLKMARLEQEKKQQNVENLPRIEEGLIKLLSYAKIKPANIDWSLILLAHLKEFLGSEKLLELVKQGIDYNALETFLDPSEVKILASNMLAYSYSINETELVTRRSL